MYRYCWIWFPPEVGRYDYVGYIIFGNVLLVRRKYFESNLQTSALYLELLHIALNKKKKKKIGVYYYYVSQFSL